MPLAFSQVDDGYSVDETVGSVPERTLGVDDPTGVNTILYVPAATLMPDADTKVAPVGFRIASTGTTEVARVVPRNGTTGEVVVVAVLLIAQYPAVPAPGPRTTT